MNTNNKKDLNNDVALKSKASKPVKVKNDVNKKNKEPKTEFISFSGKEKIKIFWELFVLIFKSFFRNPRGTMFMYIVPAFFLLLFTALKLGLNGMPDNQVNASKFAMSFAYTALPSLTIITSLAPAIVEWKNSIFLKRVEDSGIKKGQFLIALWVVYLLLAYSAAITQMIIAGLLDTNNFWSHLSGVNWGEYILGLTLLAVMCIAIASFFGGIFSNEGAAQGVIMPIYFVCIFLSGLMLMPATVESSKVIQWICRIIPVKSPIWIIAHATSSANFGTGTEGWSHGWLGMVDFSHKPMPLVGDRDFGAIWVPLVISLTVIVGLFTLTIFTFRWNTKK